MPNNFFSEDGDLEQYFVTDYWLIDQYIGNQLWVWGGFGNGELGVNDYNRRSTPVTTFAGGTNWKQVSSGQAHTAAIKTDGTLWVWGRGNEGQLGDNAAIDKITPITTFAGGTNWKQVDCGYRFTAAIKTDGTLWVWGRNNFTQLGTNDTTNRSTPVTTFAGGTNWKQISFGEIHTAAIKTDGTLWTWGNTGFGELGAGDTVFASSTPITTFAGGTDWKQVSVGDNHTAAIKTDGTLWVWGYNGYIGTGKFSGENSIYTPVTTFTGGTNWKQVSCGQVNIAAIKTDGTLWTWGATYSPGDAPLLLGRPSQVVTPVTTFAGGTNWADTATGSEEELYTLSAGYTYTAAIKTDGTLWTWGLNQNGELGTNDRTARYTPITTFTGGTNWKQISFGRYFTSAIKTDGTLWTWGANGARLGTNDTTTRSTPVTTFAGGTNWKQVSSGNIHTAAIKTDGTLWTWGYGSFGNLGTNDATNRSTPVTTFAGGTNWKQVSSGGLHTAAIKTDGTLWVWGRGTEGQLGVNDTTNRSTPVTTFAGGTNWKQVSSGNIHTAAIKTDGTLWTWGVNFAGQLGINDNNINATRSTPVTTFAGGTNWKQVSSGNSHTAAIKTDGTLWTWGYNRSGQLGINNQTNRSTPVTTFAGGTNWKQVSAGREHTAALQDDGVNKRLFTFGNDAFGELGTEKALANAPAQVFSGGTNWKQVSTGSYHTAAIKTDGTLWSWGFNYSGYLGTNDTIARSTPVTTFAGGTNWKQVSCGEQHTTAVKTGIELDTQILT